ncbi:MAG TPA: amidohydrolase family protein [Myxococcales bacterium]|nr:amidohydrolase family protein [Myxococcales bacterium]
MDGLPDDAAAFLAEPEGARVPAGLDVIDAHVHLFPPRVFEAIWRWFDRHAWQVRYRLHAEQVIEHLASRGVKRLVGLAYAHVPGMARELNRFMAETARAHPEVVPLATVLPGEPDAEGVLREAFGPLGLRGVKIHCHVQKLAPDDPRLDPVYRACADARLPAVVHAGREPASEAYGVDTRALCSAEAVERVLQRNPALTLVVPHLGAGEYEAYGRLLATHEKLWLDTTMAVAGFLQPGPPPTVFPAQAARLLYGTDFPNVPYAWDRELKRILAAGLPPEPLAALLAGNARRVFGA